MARRKPTDLRSHRWCGARDLRSFGNRSHTAQMGYDRSGQAGTPTIGIIDTGMDINPCHTHYRQRAGITLRRLEVPRRVARRRHQTERSAADRERHLALARSLHDHGHGCDDDPCRDFDFLDWGGAIDDPEID